MIGWQKVFSRGFNGSSLSGREYEIVRKKLFCNYCKSISRQWGELLINSDYKGILWFYLYCPQDWHRFFTCLSTWNMMSLYKDDGWCLPPEKSRLTVLAKASKLRGAFHSRGGSWICCWVLGRITLEILSVLFCQHIFMASWGGKTLQVFNDQHGWEGKQEWDWWKYLLLFPKVYDNHLWRWTSAKRFGNSLKDFFWFCNIIFCKASNHMESSPPSIYHHLHNQIHNHYHDGIMMISLNHSIRPGSGFPKSTIVWPPASKSPTPDLQLNVLMMVEWCVVVGCVVDSDKLLRKELLTMIIVIAGQYPPSPARKERFVNIIDTSTNKVGKLNINFRICKLCWTSNFL